jgi:hypothetical protein
MITIVKLWPGNEEQTSVNRTIKRWSKLPAEALTAVRCKTYIDRKRARKIIIGEEE